jgi:hypothetical protein
MPPETPELAALTPRVQEVIAVLFAEAEWAEVAHMMVHDCGRNLPFCDDWSSQQLDRLRLAALKLSGGKMEPLINAVALAQTDWRDLLMAAGFGEDVEAHNKWQPEPPARG